MYLTYQPRPDAGHVKQGMTGQPVAICPTGYGTSMLFRGERDMDVTGIDREGRVVRFFAYAHELRVHLGA